VAIAIGVHPHRHHDREVERRDAGADSERLPERVRVHVRRDLLGVLTLEQLRDPASELHDLHAADDFALRVGDHLAVLVRDDLGELVEVAVDEVPEGEHDARSPGQGHVAPAVVGLLRRLDRGVHVGRLGKDELGLRLALRRVPDLAPPGGGAGGLAAADPVLDGPHVRVLSRCHR
jgi:hypothetical protein